MTARLRAPSLACHQLAVAPQCRVRWYDVLCAGLAVTECRRNHEPALATGLHALHSLVPTANHLAIADPEREWLATIARAVELRALLLRCGWIVEPAGVVNDRGLALRDAFTGALHDIDLLQLVGRRDSRRGRRFSGFILAATCSHEQNHRAHRHGR